MRMDAGLTQREVAEALEWSPAKLLRIENGQVGISRIDLLALLDHYGVDDPERQRHFLALARRSKKQVWTTYRDVLNLDFINYLGYEGAASVIRQFELTFVPGLLQTEEYARALIQGLSTPGEKRKVDRQVQARMARQEIIHRPDPPRMFFMLDEAVVHRWVGAGSSDATIMRRQLQQLAELDATPHIDIHVIPFSSGVHLGMMGSFVILEFPDPVDDDLLFIENGRKALVTREDRSEIERYKGMFWGFETAVRQRPIGEVLDRILRDIA
ncbi:transcriptional regulator [Phytohabitans suffuscus]|uniref:Transcriptional regulator n=1 Tax=Phytohabitans suffuscus TaxID=624315 RepID=A0A6F8YHG9_9ACTN|nr:transcriptional regulator [Phytohabitans suffuscus]